MPVKSNIEALRETMAAEMRRDPTIIITGEDVGQRGGVFRATEGLFAEFGPSRVIDSPLSELSIVGVGIGMALNGIRPICEIQFADFIHPAFNQIVNEAAKMRYRSNGQFCVPMVIRAPYGGGISGALYHSQSIEAIFCHTPGLYVLAPSTPYDTAGLLRSALRAPDPVLFLEHKKLYRAVKGEVPDGRLFCAHRQGRRQAAGRGLDHHCLRPDAARIAEGGRGVGTGGRERGSARPAHPLAAG